MHLVFMVIFYFYLEYILTRINILNIVVTGHD